MAIGSGVPYNEYTGNGVSTVYAFGFTLLDADDLVVTIDGVAASAFTISGLGVAAGGSVTFSAAPANGAEVLLRRVIALIRTTEYQNNGDLQAVTVNDDFDRIWLALQQADASNGQHLRVPELAGLPVLPPAATRANTMLGFDSAGDPTALVPASGSAADVLTRLADAADPAKGAALVGLYDGHAPAYLKTVSDMLNFQDISLLRFIPQNLHADILAGTSITDIAAYFQEAIDEMSTGLDTVTGGTLKLHRGRWCIGSKVIARTGHVDSLSSLNIIGDGMHNTQVYALTGFSGSSMLELLEPTFCKVEGLHLFGAYNATTGLHVMDGSEITIRDVFTQQNNGPGFQFTNNFMVTLERLRAKTSTIGFNFLGPHTSVGAKNLYALDNSSAGFFITDMTYGHFDTCASDNNREGYLVQVAQGLKFTACGAESCDRAGWHFEASAAANATSANCDGIGAALEQCFGYNNNTGGGYASAIYSSQADTSTLDVRVEGFKEVSTTGVSILMAGSTTNHVLRTTEDCAFLGSVSGAALTCHRPDKRRGSATYDPPSLADGAGVTTTVTVAGVQFGDYCQASFAVHLEGITLTAWVSASDTVSVRFQNESGGILDLGSGTLRVVVTPGG